MTKIKNLEQLLSSEDTNNSIIEIDNYICELCEYGENIEKLTKSQTIIFFNQNLEREINNGGLNQYFCNSSGDFAHETIESLKTIGANKTANILQKAIDQFPEKLVPKDRDERVDLVEEIEENANVVWEELDEFFFKYEDDLTTLNLNFIKQNITDF